MIRIFNHRFLWIAVAALFLLFYFIADPMESWFMPQCVFHHLTGLQCMGCGAQRMIHALTHGEIQEAIRANALLFFSLPFLAFLLYLELNRKKHEILYKKIHNKTLIISISIILFLWLIIRNIYGI